MELLKALLKSKLLEFKINYEALCCTFQKRENQKIFRERLFSNDGILKDTLIKSDGQKFLIIPFFYKELYKELHQLRNLFTFQHRRYTLCI